MNNVNRNRTNLVIQSSSFDFKIVLLFLLWERNNSQQSSLMRNLKTPQVVKQFNIDTNAATFYWHKKSEIKSILKSIKLKRRLTVRWIFMAPVLYLSMFSVSPGVRQISWLSNARTTFVLISKTFALLSTVLFDLKGRSL